MKQLNIFFLITILTSSISWAQNPWPYHPLSTVIDAPLIGDQEAGIPSANRNINSYTLGNSYWLASLSGLVYRAPNVIDSVLKNWGLENTKIFTTNKKYYNSAKKKSHITFRNNKEINLQAMYTEFQGTGIFLFAGTDFSKYKEYLLNAQVLKTKIKRKINVHSGYLSASFLVQSWVQNIIRDRKEHVTHFFFSGHSKGGAIAELSAYFIMSRSSTSKELNKPHVEAIYTYGAPPIGNSFYVKHIHELAKKDKIGLYHIEAEGDPVPTIIPRYAFDYQISGTRLKLKSNGSFSIYSKDPMINTRFDNHRLKNYLKLIISTSDSYRNLVAEEVKGDNPARDYIFHLADEKILKKASIFDSFLGK